MFLAHPPLARAKHRELLALSLVGSFAVDGFCLSTTAQMMLKGSGRTTGLVVVVTADATVVVPILEDLVLDHAMRELAVGERTVVDTLLAMIKSNQMNGPGLEALPTAKQYEIAKNLLVRVYTPPMCCYLTAAVTD